MNILRENIGQLNDVITIEIEPADYNEQVDKSLKDLRRKANIPGFRAGHVPMSMIQKMYRKSVIADEISKIINDKLLNYLKENKIDILFEPIALPDKTEGDFDADLDTFKFSFEIGIHPEFELDYEKAKDIKLLKIKASNDDIEEEIKKLRHKMGKFSSTETVVEEDMMLVTVLAEHDNAEEFTASLLLSYVKPEKQDEFIGKKLNDVITFNTLEVFKGEHERSTFLKTKIEELDKAAVTISVKIDAIHHMEPAELNEEFYTKAFPNDTVKDEKSLKDFMKSQIELSYERDEKMYYHSKVMSHFIDNTGIPLPDDFIKRFLVESKGEEYTNENIDEKYEGIRKSILYQLIEEQIAKTGDINIDNEEVSNYLKSYIRSSYFGIGNNNTLPEDQEKMIESFSSEMMKKPENLKNAYDNIFAEKVINELISKVSPKVKNLSFDDFIKATTEIPAEKKAKAKK